MKNILFICAVIFSLQSVIAQKVTFGVKGGLNMSSFTENFDSPFDYKYKFGFQVGGFTRIELTDKLFLQPELLYSLQGTKYDIELTGLVLPLIDDPFFNDGEANGKQNESNIILPLMIRYYLTENFNIEAGPQLDYLFNIKSDRIVLTSEGVVDEGDDSVNESDFNFGLNAGIGYDFDEKLGIGLRYNYGFNRLKKSRLVPYDSGFKRRNSVFSLSLEYLFN